jgi:2Fe-2S ferredoxin
VPTLIFVEKSGARRAVAAIAGESLMVAATRAGVDGIIGECGGSAMCATCHCRADANAPLPPIGSLEAETLEYVAQNVTPESRLACQIMATETMDGVVLWVAT